MTDSRPNWDEYFLGIAEAVAVRADCTRRKVGAVIVDKSNRIVATGYNGAPTNWRGCTSGFCPRGRDLTIPSFEQGNSDYSDCIAVHAEANALLYSDRSSIEGGKIYITCSPCGECWKLLSNSGLQSVMWPGGFRSIQGQGGLFG